MSEMLTLAVIIERLKNADNILILCHKNPDGDTLGSAGALYWMLKSLNKTAAILCHDAIPERYAYMKLELFENKFEPEYIVAVDVAGLQLFGDDVVEYGEKCDLCIDHHPTNNGYADALFLDSSAAATAEIIYKLVSESGVEITPTMAACLYTGIATDTGCFKFANTTAQTHIIAAKLVELGADLLTLNNILFESKSRSRIDIERIALQNLRYFYSGKCAVITITKDDIEKTGAANTDLEGITGMPRMIEGVLVGITMRQQPTGSYKVSVRTSENVNANAIAARLGGGGHQRAAGCEIIGGLDFATDAILAEVAKELSLPPEQVQKAGGEQDA